jgi:zinc transporter
MSEEDGLICAWRLDGQGGGREVGWDELSSGAENADTWVHLHFESERVRKWLREESGLSGLVVEALLYEETRPRCAAVGDGLLINLRGVNLNPGADPGDMVQLRLYVDRHRMVSVRRRKLMAIQDISDKLAEGRGPKDSADFIVSITGGLMERMGPVISDLDDRVDDIEDRVLMTSDASLRGELWQMRRQAIALRRYIAPQREAMARLVTEKISWIEPHIGQRLREIADRITRYVEDLDAARERASIVQDELTTRLTEQMNKNMYVISIIAAIFLPLSLLTGLLGINVGGIPGEKWPWAFAAVSIGIVLLGVVEYYVFRKLKWL